jgi:hypothetical protein
MTEPPTMGGRLTANSSEEPLEPTSDPFSLPNAEPPQLLDRKSNTPASAPPSAPPSTTYTPPPPSWAAPATPSNPVPATPATPPAPNGGRTLTELEESVDSPHIKTESVNEARDEVNQALNNVTDADLSKPIEALGAQQLGGDLHPAGNSGTSTDDTAAPQVSDPTAPPPVPPPIPFQFGNPSPPPPPAA